MNGYVSTASSNAPTTQSVKRSLFRSLGRSRQQIHHDKSPQSRSQGWTNKTRGGSMTLYMETRARRRSHRREQLPKDRGHQGWTVCVEMVTHRLTPALPGSVSNERDVGMTKDEEKKRIVKQTRYHNINHLASRHKQRCYHIHLICWYASTSLQICVACRGICIVLVIRIYGIVYLGIIKLVVWIIEFEVMPTAH